MSVQLSIPNRKELREFGFVTGGLVAALFGVLFPWLLSHRTPMWPWVLAALLVGSALIAPASLRVVYTGWMKFGHFMSRITTPLILGIVFYVVVSPIARVRALLGKDSMARRLDPAAETYRVRSSSRGANDLEKPY
jgi:hypothetical protein